VRLARVGAATDVEWVPAKSAAETTTLNYDMEETMKITPQAYGPHSTNQLP